MAECGEVNGKAVAMWMAWMCNEEVRVGCEQEAAANSGQEEEPVDGKADTNGQENTCNDGACR